MDSQGGWTLECQRPNLNLASQAMLTLSRIRTKNINLAEIESWTYHQSSFMDRCKGDIREFSSKPFTKFTLVSNSLSQLFSTQNESNSLGNPNNSGDTSVSTKNCMNMLHYA